MISQKLIEEFRQIMREDYGEELTDEEARKQGAFLIKYFELLYKLSQKNENK